MVVGADGLRSPAFSETVLRFFALENDCFTVPFSLNGLQVFSINLV